MTCTAGVLGALGLSPTEVSAALAGVWRAPDPVALAHPLTDLADLLGALHASGRRVAIVTSDDRAPTERTLEALGLGALVAAVVCADDDVPTKPAPDAVLRCCALLGTVPSRTAVVGDSPADIVMARQAGAGLAIGVRTGIGDDADLADADALLNSVASLRAVIHG